MNAAIRGRFVIALLVAPAVIPPAAGGADRDGSAPLSQRTEGNLLRAPFNAPGWMVVPGAALGAHGDYVVEPSGTVLTLYLPEVQGESHCGIWRQATVEAGREYLVSINVLCDHAGEIHLHYVQDHQPWRTTWSKTYPLVPGVNRIHGFFKDDLINPGEGSHSIRFTLRKLTGSAQLSDPLLLPVTMSKDAIERSLRQQTIPGARLPLLEGKPPESAAAAALLDRLLQVEELFAAERAAWRRAREATSAFKSEPRPPAAEPATPVAAIYERLLEKTLPAPYEAAARLRLGQARLLAGRVEAAAESFERLTSIPLAADAARAVRKELLAVAVGGQAEAVPVEIFRQIAADREARTAERRIALQFLGHALIRAGRPAEARAGFDQVRQMPGLSAKERLDLGLAAGHAVRGAGDGQPARDLYRQVGNDPRASVPHRVFAAYGIADSFAREHHLAEARDALERVLAMQAGLLLSPLPAHLAAETGWRQAELGGAPPLPDFRTPIPPLPRPAVEYWVAPDGDDAAPGTERQPFATLARARDAIRDIRKDGQLPPGGAAVVIRGGEYPVSESFRLTAADGGSPGAPVVYRVAEGERATFYGGKRLAGLTPVTDPEILARLPQDARGRVLQLDLRASGVTEVSPLGPHGWGYTPRIHTEVFWNGPALAAARWPNQGYVQTVARKGPGVFAFDFERAARWSKAKEIMLFGFWDWDWATGVMGPAALDPGQKQFSGPPPSGGFLEHGVGQRARFYVFNLLEEIDRPGECFLDRAAGMLYVDPPSDAAKAVVELSMLDDPFVSLENASHLVLRGLRFDCGRHSGIVMRGGTGNLIAGCTVSRVAWDGITVDGGTDHGVFGCDIHHIGRSPVRMAGGNELTLEPSGHFLENCHIWNFSRIDRSYTHVSIGGVGTRCLHNLIHDAPSRGISGGGNDRLVAFNEVYDVVRELDDQGAIDFGFDDPAARGNRIMYNFVHDTGGGGKHVGTLGIRLDDGHSGELIYGNVLFRCQEGGMGAVNIHGGKDNIVDNNLIIDCGIAVGQAAWGQANWERRLKRESVVKHLLDREIGSPPYSIRYPELATLARNADRNFIWRNLIVRCGLPFSTRGTDANEIVDNLVVTDDPGFVAPERLDFGISPDAPIFSRGSFRRIPFERIGPYEHELRATWPIVRE